MVKGTDLFPRILGTSTFSITDLFTCSCALVGNVVENSMKLFRRSDLCSYISRRLWKFFLVFARSAERQHIHCRIFNPCSIIVVRARRPRAETAASLAISKLTCLLICLLALYAGRTEFAMCITTQASIVI